MEHFERYGVIEDRGGELVQVRNLVNDDTFWTKRSRLKRYDGCWVMLTDRAVELLNAARKRQVAKAAKKVAAESTIEEGDFVEMEVELAMQGPSRTIRTSTSGGK